MPFGQRHPFAHRSRVFAGRQIQIELHTSSTGLALGRHRQKIHVFRSTLGCIGVVFILLAAIDFRVLSPGKNAFGAEHEQKAVLVFRLVGSFGLIFFSRFLTGGL